MRYNSILQVAPERRPEEVKPLIRGVVRDFGRVEAARMRVRVHLVRGYCLLDGSCRPLEAKREDGLLGGLDSLPTLLYGGRVAVAVHDYREG